MDVASGAVLTRGISGVPVHLKAGLEAGSWKLGSRKADSRENFWSLLKRAIKGTDLSVELCHLFRYLDEQPFRFNERSGKRGRSSQKRAKKASRNEAL